MQHYSIAINQEELIDNVINRAVDILMWMLL